MIRTFFLSLCALLIGTASAVLSATLEIQPASVSSLVPGYLRCEYLQNPLAIETRFGPPRLSWILTSTNRAQKQAAYQILVASTSEKLADNQGDMWDSGRVDSEATAHIEYKGAMLQSDQRVWWKLRVWGKDATLPSAWSTNAFFQTGLLNSNDWNGVQWIGTRGYDRRLPCPLFRSPPIVLEKPILRATVFASAKGVYQLWLNGRQLGKNILAPEWTDYRKTIQYQAYDVTSQLFSGSRTATNIIGAYSSEGWFADTNSFIETQGPPPYGPPSPQLALLLEIENTDGTKSRLTTSTDWLCSTNGPIRRVSLYDGEYYDANREAASTNWTWPDATLVTFTNQVTGTNVDVSQMASQPNEPIQLTQLVTPIDSWATTNERGESVRVYDLGQNIVGWCRIVLKQANSHGGAQLRLRHAERLKLDATNGVPAHGSIDVHNLDYSLGAAKQTDFYVLNEDARQEFQPHFTYHGFRYVEVLFPPGVTASNLDLIGCVLHSASPETGTFSCSNPQLTRLMDNIKWTIRGNLYGVMTDAPQRPEREGYLGSEMLICQTACYDFDLAAFYTKWLRDIRAAQQPSGAYPIYAPWNGNRYDGWDPGWQVGGIFFPWAMHLNYGDTRILREHYASMTNWLRYISSACPPPAYVWRSVTEPKPEVGGNNISYGDWLNGDAFFHYPAGWPSGTAHASITNLLGYGTAWAAHSSDLAKNISDVLSSEAQVNGGQVAADFYAHHRDFFTELSKRIRNGFTNSNNHFVSYDPQGKIVAVDNNSQAACVAALYFDMLPENQRVRVARELVCGPYGIENYNTNYSASCTNHLSTGNQFAGRELLELSRNGYGWKAYEVITNAEFPSWLYWVANGATTCWERWNSYLSGPGPNRGYADYNEPKRYGERMSFNSFNSLPFGAVGEWMWRTVAGINLDPSHAAFANTIFCPQAGGGVTWCSSSVNTIHGLVSCCWTNDVKATNATITLEIPANTTGALLVPTTNLAAVTEHGQPVTQIQGFIGAYPTNTPNWHCATVIQLASGRYNLALSNATFEVIRPSMIKASASGVAAPFAPSGFNGVRFASSMAALAGVLLLLMRPTPLRRR